MTEQRGKRRTDGPAPRFRWGETQSLLVVVFVCGGVLMAFEMVGSRILAPTFGSTVFVWGSLIGVFLGALSLGYLVGGRVADKWPSFFVLGAVIAVTGLIVLAVPLYAPACCQWIDRSSPGRSINPLISSVLLFFIPSVLLGMVSPFSVRLQARTVATVGNVAGRLYALSTLGSIAGTLAATFWMIPSYGTSNITKGLGVTLIAVSLLSLVPGLRRQLAAGRRGGTVGTVAGILVAIGLLAVPSPSFIPLREGEKLVAELDSPYQHIGVVLVPYAQQGDRKQWAVRMVFDEYIESEVYVESGDPKDIRIQVPYTSGAKYTDMLHLPFLFNPDATSVLLVGGGGGIIPTIFRRDYPEVSIDVVELDPAVVRVAERYFGFKPNDGKTRTIVMDGRVYIRDCKKKYDIIILDAFTGGRPPFHLLTAEFLQQVKGCLTRCGVVHLNIISAIDDKNDKARLYRAMHNTFRQVFGKDHVYVFPKWYDPRYGHSVARTYGINIELIATNFKTLPHPLPKQKIVERADRLARAGRIKIASVPIHARNHQPEERGKAFPADPVLTDDFAPVDMMLTD